ncbi:MAG: hypothetical protein E7254_01200 [Lachnospiraceae bacterium]|nr:hypothetical protein [Lachnospiraceae bacterium]
MGDLTELELQNIRHLIMGYETSYDKMTTYAKEVSDSQFKQFFDKAAKDAENNKQMLLKYLG